MISEAKTEELETDKYNNFKQGLDGKGGSKRIRLCGPIQAFEAAFMIENRNMKAKSLSLPVLTEEEMTKIMEESLIISKETVKKAAFYVEYSDNIAIIMHEAQHDLKSKEMHVEEKKPWLVSLDEVEMSEKKVLQFGNQVDKIYSMERTSSNELLVKTIQSKNCFPGLSLKIRTKLQLNKNQMCLYFLKCLEKNGLLTLSENEKVVKIFEKKSQM